MASYLRLVFCAFFHVDFSIDPFCAFVFCIASGLYTRPYQLLCELLGDTSPHRNGLKEISGNLFVITSYSCMEVTDPLIPGNLPRRFPSLLTGCLGEAHGDLAPTASRLTLLRLLTFQFYLLYNGNVQST